MSQIHFPITVWNSPPQAHVNLACSTEDGTRILCALSNGCLWLSTFQGLNASGTCHFHPFIYLMGHTTPVTCILYCKFEIEGPVLNETVAITGSTNGELFMWDLSDGRCLQANAVESMGCITGLKLNSSCKILICSGQSNYMTLVDPSCLQVIKQVDVVGDWTSHFALVPTESYGIDRVLTVLMDGSIKECVFDESKLEFSRVQSVGHAPNAFQILVNPFDKRIILVLQSHVASVYMWESTGSLRTLVKFESLDCIWKGGKFITLRTLLLWNQYGSCFIYYLGSPTDLVKGPFSQASNTDLMMLISNGSQGIWTSQDVKMGDFASFRQFVLLGEFSCPSSMGESTSPYSICHVPMDQSLSRCAQHLLVFSKSNVHDLYIHTFSSGHSTPTLNEFHDSLTPLESQLIFNESLKTDFYPFWSQVKRDWTCIVLVLKKYLAIGTESGTIHLIPFSFLFTSKEISLEKDSLAVFNLHSIPVTSLYGTEYKQLQHSKLLLAGTDDGWVYIYDLHSKQSSLSFCCHSSRVLGFVGFAHAQEPRYKSWVASISQDHSISIFDLQDKTLLYRFYGHLFDISRIYFKPQDDILIVSCIDGKAFVWQLTTGHLERMVILKNSPGLVLDSPIEIDVLPLYSEIPKATAKQTVDILTSRSFNHSIPLMVCLVNSKRLIDEVYNGQQVLTPPTPMAVRTMSQNRVNQQQESHKKRVAAVIQRGDKLEPDVVHNVFSCILSWGLDSHLDSVCETKLGLSRPGSHVTFGIRGANGALSLLAPNPHSNLLHWTTSPTSNASRLLNIMSLCHSVLSTQSDVQDFISTLLTHYSLAVPSLVGRNYKFPSFSFLIKHWQDPVVDIQQAARAIFSVTLSKMSVEDKTTLINCWKPHLPSIVIASGRSCGKSHLRAAVILGIMGTEDATTLPLRICKDVAESLDLLLREDLRSPFPMIAVELLGKGFNTWEPHINGAATLRYLVTMTGLISSNSSLTSAIMIAARQSIINIATVNPALVISTLSFDLAHSKTSTERAGSLKLMGMFFGKRLLLLYPYLSRIVDAMVKTLDPNTPEVRESLLPIVTVNFAELVRSYPNISFHGPSQRLAIGTLEGTVIVYDLRTATKVAVLEGHIKSVSCVSFSNDGKLMATYSIDENCLKFWQPYSGLIGSLVGALSGSAAGQATGAALANISGGGKIKPYRSFNVGPPQGNIPLAQCIEKISFEWLNDRSVKLKSINDIDLNFTI